MSWKAGFVAAAFGAALLVGAGSAQANPRDFRRCQDRFDREEAKLRRDIGRHGFNSHQARNRRAKLFRLRQQCGFGYGFRSRDDGRYFYHRERGVRGAITRGLQRERFNDRRSYDRDRRDYGRRHRHDRFCGHRR